MSSELTTTSLEATGTVTLDTLGGSGDGYVAVDNSGVLSVATNLTISSLEVTGTTTLDGLSGFGPGSVAVDNYGVLSWKASLNGLYQAFTSGTVDSVPSGVKVVTINLSTSCDVTERWSRLFEQKILLDKWIDCRLLGHLRNG